MFVLSLGGYTTGPKQLIQMLRQKSRPYLFSNTLPPAVVGGAIKVRCMVAYGQALRGALAAGREKKGELATTSLEFEYLHRKSRCEMLIGGNDISNDVITLGTCLSMFVYIRTRFNFSLIGGNL